MVIKRRLSDHEAVVGKPVAVDNVTEVVLNEVCRHCGERIVMLSGNWVHQREGVGRYFSFRCAPVRTVAEPGDPKLFVRLAVDTTALRGALGDLAKQLDELPRLREELDEAMYLLSTGPRMYNEETEEAHDLYARRDDLLRRVGGRP